MRSNTSKSVTLTFFIVLAIWLPSGCGSNKYRQPISKFQASAALVSAEARRTYSEINRLQRTAEIKRRARNGTEIRDADLKAVQPLDKKDLQARLDALDRLNEYIDLLVSIANSDSPENISKSATDLSGALANLVNTTAGLSGGNANFKSKVNNAFGLGSVVVSEVLKAFIERKIRKGLETAVQRGERPINNLIDAVRDDLIAYRTVTLAVFDTERTDILKFYNCELAKKSPNNKCPRDDGSAFSSQRLESYKTQLIASEDLLETLRHADPTESLARMRKAHSKLVSLARSNTPATFAEAVAAIEDFAAAAKGFGDAVEKLKDS